jgi:hypothetical protein
MATPRRKRKPESIGSLMLALQRSQVSLTRAVTVIAERLVCIEAKDEERVVHGFASAESCIDIESAPTAEEVDEWAVIGGR